jgi:hypothetical protein
MPTPSFEEDFVEPHLVEEVEDKSALFVGKVFELLNRSHWKFGDDDESWHPGACYEFDVAKRLAMFLKGTSKDPGRRRRAYVEVDPNHENGLTESTFFSLNQVFPFRSKVIELAHRDRVLGTLSSEDLDAIRFGLNEFTRMDD